MFAHGFCLQNKRAEESTLSSYLQFGLSLWGLGRLFLTLVNGSWVPRSGDNIGEVFELGNITPIASAVEVAGHTDVHPALSAPSSGAITPVDTEPKTLEAWSIDQGDEIELPPELAQKKFSELHCFINGGNPPWSNTFTSETIHQKDWLINGFRRIEFNIERQKNQLLWTRAEKTYYLWSLQKMKDQIFFKLVMLGLKDPQRIKQLPHCKDGSEEKKMVERVLDFCKKIPLLVEYEENLADLSITNFEITAEDLESWVYIRSLPRISRLGFLDKGQKDALLEVSLELWRRHSSDMYERELNMLLEESLALQRFQVDPEFLEVVQGKTGFQNAFGTVSSSTQCVENINDMKGKSETTAILIEALAALERRLETEPTWSNDICKFVNEFDLNSFYLEMILYRNSQTIKEIGEEIQHWELQVKPQLLTRRSYKITTSENHAHEVSSFDLRKVLEGNKSPQEFFKESQNEEQEYHHKPHRIEKSYWKDLKTKIEKKHIELIECIKTHNKISLKQIPFEVYVMVHHLLEGETLGELPSSVHELLRYLSETDLITLMKVSSDYIEFSDSSKIYLTACKLLARAFQRKTLENPKDSLDSYEIARFNQERGFNELIYYKKQVSKIKKTHSEFYKFWEKCGIKVPYLENWQSGQEEEIEFIYDHFSWMEKAESQQDR